MRARRRASSALGYHLVRLGNEERLDRPEQIVRYMDGAFAAESTVESVWVIALNTNFRPLGRVKIGSGTLNSYLVHSREVFRAAIMASACSIVLVHNHPSGDPAPSFADCTVTRKIREAGQIMRTALTYAACSWRKRTITPLASGSAWMLLTACK